MLEDLATSSYLMTAYATSSDSWVNFRRTGQQASLYEVAAILCGPWRALSEDDDFFDGLDDMAAQGLQPDVENAIRGSVAPTSDASRHQFLEEISTHRDTDKLLARELVVLVQAGMDSVHALRLVSDLQTLIAPQLYPLPTARISALRNTVPALASELYKAQQTLKVFDYDAESAAEAGRAPHRIWVRDLRVVAKALAATARAAGAVGNIAAALASFGVVTGFALASVLAGAQVMTLV